jgi:hypothetical protein
VSKLIAFAARLVTVAYGPRPDERAYLERANTRKASDVEVTVAALSDRESQAFFGVRMARRGMQPVWIDIHNGSSNAFRLEPLSIDPAYYPPLEAAYVNHFAMLKRLLSFGLLAWLFLPVLPLLPFKLYGARRANRRINAFFKEHGYPGGPIPPGGEKSGFMFTTLNEGAKDISLELRAGDQVLEFSFSLEVPGLVLDSSDEDPSDTAQLADVDEGKLRTWLEQQPRSTTNKRGNAEGDPLNLVVVGSRSMVQQCFGARWDEAETVTVSTSLKMAKAFLLGSEYLYAPVSPLFVAGRQQQLALQRARSTINERIHLRLWRTSLSFGKEQVWIGQISRDIGVRMTLNTWSLTTHKIDPDVDEARDYVLDDLMAAGSASRVGYVAGAEAATPSAPRLNLTDDPYFTDGLRAVVVLSRSRTQASFFAWDSNG